jgi:dipeptidyl aminopeptidase/acylaminoacyl peptidase
MEANLDFEPAKYFEQVGCPIFLALGQHDEVVDSEESCSIFEGLFSGKTTATARIYPNANHQLQDGVDENANWNPTTLDEIADWILTR